MLPPGIAGVFSPSAETAVHSSLSQQKPLIVFLTPEGDTGDTYVARYLVGSSEEATAQLVADIKQKYVCLSLTENSGDFNSFRQIFPALTVPSIVIVKEGKLLDVFNGDVPVDLFLDAVKRYAPIQPPVAVAPVPTDIHLPAASSTSSQPSSLSSSATASASISGVSTTTATPEPHDISVTRHRQEVLRARKQERDRLNNVRHQLDLDRKERESLKREKENLKAAKSNPGVRRPRKSYDECMLSIKLLDGTTLRNEFQALDNLEVVRKWVDEQEEIVTQDEFMPSFAKSTVPQIIHYTFFAPSLPGHTFSVEQEKELLQSLGLCPRSALFLKPVYGHPESPQPAQSGSAVLKTVKKSLSLLGHALYSFFDYGVEDARNSEHEYNELEGQGNAEESLNLVSDTDDHSERLSRTPTPFMTIKSHPSSSSLYNLRRQNSNTSTSIKSKEFTKNEAPRPHNLHRLRSFKDEKMSEDETASPK